MNDSITPDVVRYVAKLACLELGDAETDRFAAQLSLVAGHFSDMDEFDTSDVLPATHARDIRNVFRADESRPCLTAESLLAAAPAAEDNMFRVPKILEDEK
jgi:aspartyl-tRNA(Asn)/glutamyl-tRNA(Gln) amidotransferase subunit C